MNCHSFGTEDDLGLVAAWLLLFQSYLDYLKYSPHKPVIRITVFLDGTVRYWSEINEDHPQISSCTPARLKLPLAAATIQINTVDDFSNIGM